MRKEQLSASLALPVGLLGLLGSLLAVMVRSFPFGRNIGSWVFLGFVVAAAASFATCLIQLARAYHRQTYRYLPLLGELNRKLEEWRAFYQDAGYLDAEQDFFNGELRAKIIEAADENTVTNDARSALLHWARLSLFWLLGFSTLAGMVYLGYHMRSHA